MPVFYLTQALAMCILPSISIKMNQVCQWEKIREKDFQNLENFAKGIKLLKPLLVQDKTALIR